MVRPKLKIAIVLFSLCLMTFTRNANHLLAQSTDLTFSSTVSAANEILLSVGPLHYNETITGDLSNRRVHNIQAQVLSSSAPCSLTWTDNEVYIVTVTVLLDKI
jgi:hypothetical protein